MSQALKAIVVEDDEVIAQTIAETLRELGHEVCGVAGDVLEMATLLQQYQPDLITLDLNLGKLHEGVGIATVLQAAGPIPIVFVTGAATVEQKKEILALDAASLVLKPFTPEHLKAGIAQALKRSSQASAAAWGG